MGQTANFLGELWIAGASGGSDVDAPADEVGRSLEQAFGAARARHPGIPISDEDLMLYALARAEGREPFSPERTADLLLACGLSRGDPAALRTFDAELAPLIRVALEKLRIDRTRLDEAIQRLRIDLFIAQGDALPRIAQYKGQGDLTGWLRVTATRLALRAQKSERPTVSDDDLFDRLPDGQQNVELEVLRSRYRERFREAFRDAIQSLGDRERTLLRQHHADGLSIDALAPIHGVHRATVARWIVSAEKQILDRTKARFRELLSATPAECESVMRLLKGELSMSLRWLAS